jgi:hypothetical protein
MDEIKVEGEPLPRFRLFISNAKHEAIGASVCESDNLDDLRMFRRRADRRYVLYEWRNRINLDRLKIGGVEEFGKLRSKDIQSGGNGWYCKNTKCGKLIAAEEIRSFGEETLLRITCPHCSDHHYYRCSDYGWKKSQG